MVEWDYTHHIVRVLNFGLPPALVVGADGVVKSTLPSQHLPLGILAEIDRGCRNVEVRLSDGDCLYFYTDGITKARNKFGEQFGEKRLHPLLTRQDVSEHRFDEIRRSIDEFRGDTPQWDDMAFVEIRCDATAEPHPAEEKKIRLR